MVKTHLDDMESKLTQEEINNSLPIKKCSICGHESKTEGMFANHLVIHESDGTYKNE